MFGMGFFEIFFILLVAIMVLGPEKLPKAMVEGVRFFRKLKKGILEAKDAIDNELNIAELKEEAQEYKKSLQFTKDEIAKNLDIKEAKEEIASIENILNNDIDNIKSKKDDKFLDNQLEDKPTKSKKDV